jgi:hypothetical protein
MTSGLRGIRLHNGQRRRLISSRKLACVGDLCTAVLPGSWGVRYREIQLDLSKTFCDS